MTTERQQFFRDLAHQVHLGRCKDWPWGTCTKHEDPDYFTAKDNDIASGVLHWLDRSGHLNAAGLTQ